MGIGEMVMFYILKILLLILQISFFLILFILFLLLVIILANIKYIFKSSTKTYEDDIYSQDFNFKLTYLFGIISVYCDKKNDKIRIAVKVFKKFVYKDVKYFSKVDDIVFKNQREEKPDSDEPILKENVRKQEVPKNTQSVHSAPVEVKKNNETVKEEKIEAEKTSELLDDTANNNTEDKDDKKETTKEKNGKNQVTFISTLTNKDTIVKIFNACVKFLKGLKPEKFSLRLKVGFDDPSVTGQVVGAGYFISGVTGLDLLIEGEFNEETKPDLIAFCKGKTSIFKLISPFLFLGWYFIKFKILSIKTKFKGE